MERRQGRPAPSDARVDDTMVTRDLMNRDAMDTVTLHDSTLESERISAGLTVDGEETQPLKSHASSDIKSGEGGVAQSLDGSADDDEPFISQMKEAKPLRRIGGFASPIPKTSLYRQDDGQDVPNEDIVDPPNTYHMDMEVEAARLSQRNKRVLISRLVESSPRGKLSLINLCRRGLGAPEAILLKEVILSNPQLYVLKLSYNNLGDEGASIVASALFHNGVRHQLSVLDLGFNSIGDAGCGSLAVFCLAGNFDIQTVYLSGNCFSDKGALSIAGAILHGTALRSLHLAANEIGPMGMIAIAGSIAKNEARITQALATGRIDGSFVRRMEELHLANTSMKSDGFVAIPTMLMTNLWMKTLSLSSNGLDDRDVSLLAQVLTQNKLVPLESLHLSFNQITCEGVESLMNAAWGSKTLHDLRLDNNLIKDRGAQLCAVALTSIPLRTLDLSFNKVTTSGIKALMKNLAENTTMQSLSLSGIPIDQSASKALSYALAYNTSLKALYLDTCSPGFASQRHIVAGAVSNRTPSLRILTGFSISRVAITLGMPQLPTEWSNDQVLGFFRLMWRQWMVKSRSDQGGEVVRGPAPPAAIAAAAKIALAEMGRNLEHLFQTEAYDIPMTESAPVEPAGTALLERSNSGTMTVPIFTVSSEVELEDFVDGEKKVAEKTNDAASAPVETVQSPIDNTQRLNRNLRWLRLHFRAIRDVGRLPFYNADLWQLHQYYLSPPLDQAFEDEIAHEFAQADGCTIEAAEATTLTVDSDSKTGGDDQIEVHERDAASIGHKRASYGGVETLAGGPVTKKIKNVKPRIAYYPRVMVKIQSLGFKPMEQTLSLLRQLKYIESVMFAGQNPYADFNESGDAPCHADIDMILMDLL